jgi:2-C-methyl-D-erythritol 4-phosphate cytidylyltransferase/2-C-methyl-D-erythritol 2,4-cyclodiphosphate synthase
MGGRIALPKQFMPCGGAPLFWRSARTFSRLPALKGIVFVFPPEGLPDGLCPEHDPAQSPFDALVRSLESRHVLGLPWRTVAGGPRRQDSVANALAALPPDCQAVLVHDSARPFASASLMRRVAEALSLGHAAVIPGIAVSDTIKSVDADGVVQSTHDRSRLRAVQTPQGFLLAPLREAHARAQAEGWEVTDDAGLLERCGTPVLVVLGEEGNRKITTPEDIRLLDAATPSPVPCTGFGYDVHRYDGDRPFILGGVPIACDVRVAAHSDGDTLLHALMDAMLGCVGGGDIGKLFPDSDPALDNVSSGVLLAETLELCRRQGLRICHVDITVAAQIPRIAPHRDAIAANVAKLLQLPPRAVNVKATTEEGLGFTGAKQGIKVMAVVTGLRIPQ